LLEGFAEGESRVLCRVMIVDPQVAFALEI
jgi:hypothetical protein